MKDITLKDLIEEVKQSRYNGVLTELVSGRAINYMYERFDDFTHTQVFNRLSIEAQDVLYYLNDKLEAGAL